MTYLPDLQRILVEGAARLEQTQFETSAAPVIRIRRRGRLAGVLHRLTRGRLFVFAGVGLLAAGTAAAAIVELTGRQSAPPAGHLSSQAGRGSSLQVGGGNYAVSVTPDRQAGGVGLCVSARADVVGPIGNTRALRAALSARRAQLETRLSERSLSPQARSTLEHEADVVIPGLLEGLTTPNGLRNSSTLRSAYRKVLGASSSEASRCGIVAKPGSPIVAEFGQSSTGGSGAATVHTAILVFITEPQVMGVRASPSLTLLTRRSPQLPRRERIAIAVQQTVGRPTQLPLGPRAPAPIALDSQGRVIK